MKTNVRFLAVTLVILMTAACQKNEPDWNALAYNALTQQGEARHSVIAHIDQCRGRIQSDNATVRCQLHVEMLTSRKTLESRLGDASESITVAEMTHRFGDFEQGDMKTVSATLAFRLIDGAWQFQP
ncbi:hypothetical protein [Isoalcanivorax indicus]|uniref:hypothetical protein n=1 Tax=Isoalcanivorax indicus TaxID=2202653 RepID=UPI0013C4E972|nr:hypothetical protein [Isoalcanivorax indicus]